MTPETHNDDGAVWYVPHTPLVLADGTIMIRQGKPVLRASSRLTAKWTGVKKKNLARLAEAGFIRRAKAGPGIHEYYPAEVMAFIEKTEEEGFWTPERKRIYLNGGKLREQDEG
jgi:hypothetical protein